MFKSVFREAKTWDPKDLLNKEDHGAYNLTGPNSSYQEYVTCIDPKWTWNRRQRFWLLMKCWKFWIKRSQGKERGVVTSTLIGKNTLTENRNYAEINWEFIHSLLLNLGLIIQVIFILKQKIQVLLANLHYVYTNEKLNSVMSTYNNKRLSILNSCFQI